MNLVIIGYGGMGGYHAECLKKYCESKPEFPIRVTGAYDIDPERSALAEKNGYRAYKSAAEIWADPSVGAVLVATPNDIHAEYVKAAAKAGKNIICEKPIGMSSREAEEMYDAAEKAGVVFEVHQNRRWDDDFLTVKNIVDNGIVGAAYCIESRVMGGNGIPGAWRKEKAHGGGMMLDWGVHLIDQMLMMIKSPVESLYCEYSYIYGEEVDDGCSLTVNFENGMKYRIVVATDCFRNLPRWQVYGTEGTETLLMGLLKIHPVSLRFCLELSETDREDLKKKIEATGVHLSAHKELPYVYLAENLENVSELPGFAEGKFTVQDASSALAVKAAKIKPGDFVMDLCAAPGGKTILAAEYTKEAGHVLSRDVSEYKTALILENLERMHRTNVKVEVHDATVYDAEREASADVVLMDVPCSGLGVMGKKRDIKYRVTPEGLKSIHELQRQIVEAGWRYVKPGGVLLYSTCTINREENQNMAAWITEKFPFVLEEERQLLPGTDETDGFYFARLRRRT